VFARVLQRIQIAISNGEYDVTVHAVEEMAEDGLDIFDVESAILNGQVTKAETDDPRGTRYTIIGTAQDERTRVGVVGRFKETGIFLIITVYTVNE
jgi:hypothetical protein